MVDLITNSSTELFVSDTKKSVAAVKDILQSAIDLHNKSINENSVFSDIFEEPEYFEDGYKIDGWEDYHSTEIQKGVTICGIGDNSIPYWMWEFIEVVFSNVERFHLG